MNRRNFLQTSTLAGAGLAINPNAQATPILKKKSKSTIRLGVIGVGMRGQWHVQLGLNQKDTEVVAICDISDRMIADTLKLYDKAGAKHPTIYKNDEQGYLELLANKNIDAVIIATPWRWHTEMAIAAMQAGKFTGVEVCGAFSLDECWQLVNTHEATGTHLYFMENVCFRRDVMAILNMVQQGLFGEMMHLEGGYQHDLRGVKFNDGQTPYNSGAEFGEKGYSEAKWRTAHSVNRNGDLYPTHGVGPIAQYAHINRGNRFTTLTSMASKARGLHEYVVNHPKGGAKHPSAQVEFKLGDKVTTMLKANNGETFVLHHDTNLPRPYSLGFRVQGTKGLWMSVNNSKNTIIHYGKHKKKLLKVEDMEGWIFSYSNPLLSVLKRIQLLHSMCMMLRLGWRSRHCLSNLS